MRHPVFRRNGCGWGERLASAQSNFNPLHECNSEGRNPLGMSFCSFLYKTPGTTNHKSPITNRLAFSKQTFLRSLHCNNNISFVFARILGRHFGKLVDVAVACGKQSGDDTLSGFCEVVTMSAGDFLQDSMSAQQCQAAGDGSGLAKL